MADWLNKASACVGSLVRDDGNLTRDQASRFVVLADTFTEITREVYKPMRTSSERWRVRLFKADSSMRVAVYRTKALALAAFVRAAESAKKGPR